MQRRFCTPYAAAVIALTFCVACARREPGNTPSNIDPTGDQAQPVSASAGGLEVLSDVNYVDVEAGTLEAHKDIAVQQGRIVAVVNHRDNAFSGAVIRRDVAGKTIVPGYIDAHSHQDFMSKHPRENFQLSNRLHLANGVLGVRDMAMPHDFVRYCVDQRLADPTLPAPWCITGGPLVDHGEKSAWRGTPVFMPFAPPAPGLDEAAKKAALALEATKIVKQLKGEGASFVKAYSELTPEMYLALADAAKKEGLGVTGHIPLDVDTRTIAAAGQKSIEHMINFFLETSGRREQFLAEMHAKEQSDPTSALLLALQAELGSLSLQDDYRAELANELFALYKKNDICVVPTLMPYVQYPRFNQTIDNDDRKKYVPSSLVSTIHTLYHNLGTMFPWSDAEVDRFFNRVLKEVKTMSDSGVCLLIGTDPVVPMVFLGSAIHGEMQLFARAGISPANILRSATITAARFLGRDHETGSVRAGKRADLVVLNANPLSDIRHSEDIYAVVAQGQYLSRGALDALRQEAAQLKLEIDRLDAVK